MNDKLNDMLTQRSADRRSFLKGAGLTGLGLASTALLGRSTASALTLPKQANLNATDIGLLNFALNLEYLEAEVYTMAYYGTTIDQMGIAITGTGTAGATTGGAKVNFATEPSIYSDQGTEFSGKLDAIVKELVHDEQTHVQVLRAILGTNAIAKPAINLSALTVGFGNFNDFLALSRTLEDVGVSAYAGAMTQFSKPALKYAVEIAMVEAYHAATMRLLVAENKVVTTAVDTLDVLPPPTGSSYFPVNSQALLLGRTTTQLMSIVYANPYPGTGSGAFFPAGLNGTITAIPGGSPGR